MTTRVFAPAKLNLTLAVVGRRDDGYHALHSIMVPLAFGDTIEIGPRRGPGTAASGRAAKAEEVGLAAGALDTLGVAGLPLEAGPDNLVLRAIAATRAEAAVGGRPDLPALAVRLMKRIPVAAGLGGGSSDAAATIGGALAAWGTVLSPPEMALVAAQLGSDVPFFLAGGAALVTGRGEFVEPLPAVAGEAPGVLIVTPPLAISTPAVFAAYAAGARPSAPLAALTVSDELAAAFRAGLHAAGLMARAELLALANDLLPASLAVAPTLAAFRSALGNVLGRPVGQSGSGPTAWVLYPALEDAQAAAAVVSRAAADGVLPRMGEGELFIAATTFRG
jgi:4-diphosphocytidyl-2-C-methyl-D-erythritol kinase